MVNRPGSAAVAERPADAGLWLATLPNRRAERPRAVAEPAEGVLAELPGAVTDLALTHDGRLLVAAHYGQDAVSVIDTATLTPHARVDVAEPYALAVADRCYVSSAAIDEDTVVAVDIAAGIPLAGKQIAVSARGLAVGPSGETLYVARGTDNGADIAVIDIESGRTSSIPLADGAEAVIDVVRVSADGTRLYAARTTAAGAALVVVDTRTHRMLHAVDVSGSISDIAVHRDGRRVFLTGWDSELGGVLTVVDVANGRVADSIAMGGPATQLALGGRHAYVLSGERVVVIDVTGMRVVDTVDTGEVACLAVSDDATMLYLGGYDATVTAYRVGAARLRAAS